MVDVTDSSWKVVALRRLNASANIGSSSASEPKPVRQTLHTYRKHECGCRSNQPVTCGMSLGTTSLKPSPQFFDVCL